MTRKEKIRLKTTKRRENKFVKCCMVNTLSLSLEIGMSQHHLNAARLPQKFALKFTVSFPVCPPGGTARGRLGSIQTLHSASPRTMSWICPGQTREDGGHWPFPVRSCQTATAGSAAAMAGLGDGSDGVGGPGNFERFRDAASESPLRPRSRVYGRLLRRRPGGGGSAAPAGSWHKPRQHRRTDSASSGGKVNVTLQLVTSGFIYVLHEWRRC